jgi:hypothetical protein
MQQLFDVGGKQSIFGSVQESEQTRILADRRFPGVLEP